MNETVKLTLAEKKVADHLADAWNDFCNLEFRAEHDDIDFNNAIHTCQRIIAIRVARRADPDYWNQPGR